MTTARRLLFYAMLATLAVWFVTEFVLLEYVTTSGAINIGQGRVWFIYPDFALDLAQMGDGEGFFIRRTYPFVWLAPFESDYNGVDMPFWLVFMVLLVPWTVLDSTYRVRRRRELSGCCKGCGYDLTGNESGRCPECNAEVATA